MFFKKKDNTPILVDDRLSHIAFIISFCFSFLNI